MTVSTAPARPPLHVESLATIDPGRGRVHSVVTWEHYVGWADAAEGPDVDPNRVVVHDLDTKQTRVLARTRFPGGTIPRVRAGRDSLVYVDMSRVASDADPETDWHMYEVSVPTGKARLLASSSSPADRADPPLPSLSWPWVAWFQAGADGSRSVRSLDLRDGEQRELAASTAGGQLSMDDLTATVYYDDDNGSGGRDVFAVPADGSAQPRRVTTSGRADFPIARNGGLAWQEPPNADSDSLWYKAGADGEPRQISVPSDDRPTAGSNPFPGRGFVVWLLGSRLVVRDSTGALPPVSLQERDVSIPARRWVEGNRVVWATWTGIGTSNEQSTIYVAEVRVDGTQGP